MEVADTATLCERLGRRHIDLFVGDTRDLKSRAGLKIARLPNVPVAFFVQPKHPLRRKKRVTLDDAMAFPIAGPNMPAAVATRAEALPRRSERAVFNLVCDDPGTLRHLALTADAVILAPDAPALNSDIASLVTLPIAGLPRMLTHYGIVTPAGRTLSAAARVYTRLATELMAAAGQGAGP